MTPTRRAMLSATPFLAVSACAGQTAAQVSAQVVTDINNAVAALSNAIPAAAKADPKLLPPAAQTQIMTWLADAQGVLASVSTSMTATAAAPALQKAEADLNAVLAALAAVPLIPPPYSMAIAAAAVAAPFIEGYLNSVLGVPTKAAATPRLAARYGTMPLSQAEAVLAQAAKSSGPETAR